MTSLQPDLHSGMQGGAVHEPVLDLVRILSLLVNESGKICLDGFYDGVRPMESEEEKLYDAIIEHLNTYVFFSWEVIFGHILRSRACFYYVSCRVDSATLLKNSHFTDTRAHLLAKLSFFFLFIHLV